MPKTKVSSSLLQQLQNNPLEKAISKISGLIKEQPDKYTIDENNLNYMGYIYLQRKDIATAIGIFRLNTELNPYSWNVWDSMGEAYLANGDTVLAISNYKKSVALNPGNNHGIEILKKMGIDVTDLIKEVNLPITLLDTYVGKYKMDPSPMITVVREDKQLIAEARGNRYRMFASSETKFFIKEFPVQITFNKDEAWRPVSLTWNQGGDFLAKMIE